MKSKLTFLAMIMAVVFVAVSANDAFASRTRMQSLTINDTAAPYIMADSQHWSYVSPAYVSMLPGFVSFSWGSMNVAAAASIWNGSGAANLKLTPALTMCISFEVSSETLRDSVANGVMSGIGTGVAAQYAATNGGAFAALNGSAFALGTVPYPLFANGSLTFGIKIGRMTLGVQGSVVYTDDTMDDGTDEVVYQAYEPRVAVGIFLPFSATMFLDASLYASIPVVNVDNPTLGADGTTLEAVGYDISILARFTMMASRKDMLHFWFKFRTYDASSTLETDLLGTDDSHDMLRTGHIITIGISDEMKFAPNAFVFVGVDMDAIIRNYDFSGSVGAADTTAVTGQDVDVIANIRFGAEAPLVGGLTGRLGMTHKFVAYESSTIEIDTPGSDPLVNTNNGSYLAAAAANGQVNYESTVGVGFAWLIGNFNLEFNLNKQIFATGPYFLVGQTAGVNDSLCTDVTFTYVFPVAASAPAAANEEK